MSYLGSWSGSTGLALSAPIALANWVIQLLYPALPCPAHHSYLLDVSSWQLVWINRISTVCSHIALANLVIQLLYPALPCPALYSYLCDVSPWQLVWINRISTVCSHSFSELGCPITLPCPALPCPALPCPAHALPSPPILWYLTLAAGLDQQD